MSDFISKYLERTSALLKTVAEAEEKNMDQAAELIAEGFANGKTIYVFGCTHSAILAEDVFYRANTPCFWRPLWGPGMSITQTPGFLTSAAEHNETLGNDIIACSRMKKDDIIVVLSTSGKNGAPVAVADAALKKGAKVIAISSSAYKDQTGNHSKYASLWKIPGLLMIDNHVPCGDTSVTVGESTPMAPVSTIAGSFIMHTISALAVEKLIARGIKPPVFLSSNAPGGKEWNEELMKLESVQQAYLLP